MDEIRNVVGDTVSERQLVETIMKHNFDCAKALDVILNNSSETSTVAAASSASKTLTPQSAVPMETGNQKPLANCNKIHRNHHLIPSNTWLGLFDASSNFLFISVYLFSCILWFMIWLRAACRCLPSAPFPFFWHVRF